MHLADLVSPEELLAYGRSDDLPKSERERDYQAIECFAVVALRMVGEGNFDAYMTALTAIERALRRSPPRNQ